MPHGGSWSQLRATPSFRNALARVAQLEEQLGERTRRVTARVETHTVARRRLDAAA